MRRRRIGTDLWTEEIENPGRKTKRWIITGDQGDSLAEIAWHGPWRQYVLWPMLSTIFNVGCLRDLAVFLETENRAQRARRTKP